MDVTRWIEDLAGESHQHHASQPRFPDFMLPKANVEPFKRRKDQKRSRISGETFLEALPVPLEASKARDGGKPGCSRRSCSSAHDSDVVSSSSSYKYHKQVRKKPRADLYERKSLRGARNEATKKSKASRVEPETGGRKQQRKPTKSSRPVNQSKIKNPAEHLNRLTLRQDGKGIFGTAKISSHHRPGEVPDLSFSNFSYLPQANIVVKKNESETFPCTDDQLSVSLTKENHTSDHFKPAKANKAPTKTVYVGRQHTKTSTADKADHGNLGHESARSLTASIPLTWSATGAALSQVSQAAVTEAEMNGPGDVRRFHKLYHSSSQGQFAVSDGYFTADIAPRTTRTPGDASYRRDIPSKADTQDYRMDSTLTCQERQSEERDCGDVLSTTPNLEKKSSPESSGFNQAPALQRRGEEYPEPIVWVERNCEDWRYEQPLSRREGLAHTELAGQTLARNRLQSRHWDNCAHSMDRNWAEPVSFAPLDIQSENDCEFDAAHGFHGGSTRVNRAFTGSSTQHRDSGDEEIWDAYLAKPLSKHSRTGTDAMRILNEDMQYNAEDDIYHDILEEDEKTPKLNIPCVGGLDVKFILHDDQEREESKSRGGFWRPNRLY